MTRAINAATTNTPLEIPFNKFINSLLSRAYWAGRGPAPRSSSLFVRQIVPSLHVGDAFLIPCNHYFGPLGNGSAAVVTRSNRAARALLRKDHLAGAALADVGAQPAQRSDEVVIGRVQIVLAAHQKLGNEPEHHRGASQSGQHGA